MKQSIRLRLIIFLGGMLIIAWGGIAASSIYSARKEVQELFDAHLAQSARVLYSLIKHEMSELSVEGENNRPIDMNLSAPGHFYEGKISFRVRDNTGKSWFMTQNAPELAINSGINGFANVDGEREQWRVFILRDKVLDFSIEVAQSYQIRKELILEITRQVIWPFIIVIPLLMLMIWISVGRSLRPLQTVANEVKHRNPQNLEEIDLTNVPIEVLPLFISLNDLLGRLKKALSNERGFTSDAAHELRTPLAGIRAQAQVALRASSETEKDTALRHMIIGIDNTTHLVRQMLMLARLDPDIPNREFKIQDLSSILAEVAADVASIAVEKGVELEVREVQGLSLIHISEPTRLC